MKSNSIFSIFSTLISTLLILSSFVIADGDDDLLINIIVIDGKALLVDMDKKGTIVETYMEVPEYFSTQKDHKTKVFEAQKNYTRLTEAQLDQIRFIALVEEGWKMDAFMQKNLIDLASHYKQTYANQIEITVARSAATAKLVDANIRVITEQLKTAGVDAQDIVINYKQDMGEEPTRFIKVVSNLKPLRSLLAAN